MAASRHPHNDKHATKAGNQPTRDYHGTLLDEIKTALPMFLTGIVPLDKSAILFGSAPQYSTFNNQLFFNRRLSNTRWLEFVASPRCGRDGRRASSPTAHTAPKNRSSSPRPQFLGERGRG